MKQCYLFNEHRDSELLGKPRKIGEGIAKDREKSFDPGNS